MKKTFFDSIQKTLLSEAEMETLERDLNFQPVRPGSAKTLSTEQIETFNRQGCLLPLPALDDHEIAAYRRLFDKLVENVMSEGSDSFSLIDPHLNHSQLYDLMFDPRLVAYVKDLVGPDIVCWSTHLFCKLAHDNKQVAWHQDAYYWPLTPARTVTVWLAIDDADIENACMQLVAGSHLHGKISHRTSRKEEQNILRVTVDGVVETFGQIIDAELRAGQISLHSDLLLHGSGPNRSDRRRCGLTLRYVDANVQDLRDWSQCGVLISGQDRRGQWGNPPRPATTHT